MRLAWIALFSSSVALADKRTDEIATGYEKESAACKRSESGVAKVLEGARGLADETADTEKLDKGHAVVVAYCAELDGALEVLKGAASYKSVERQLDERDNKIRGLRAQSKKVIADLEPVMHRLIPKINAARSGPQQVVDKRTAAKFPSGRSIELPPLGGQWKLSGTTATDVAEYADRATLTAQPFKESTCEAEKRRLAGIDKVSLQTPEGVSWIATYGQKGHQYELACAQGTSGGVVGMVDLTGDDAKLFEELGKLVLRMMQTQLGAK